MKIPQIKIFQRASYKDIELDFNAWVLERLIELKEVADDDREDVFGIPSQTHLQYDQGLQKYVFTVVFIQHMQFEE